jgi:hypothetical protein
MTQDDSTYTKPKLRAKLKDQIQAGDKGGKPGQWSARKAQLLVREYEKAGGGYTSAGRKSDTQEHLADWGKQDWKTASGKDAKDGTGTGRYLPEVAWKLLSKAEREQTDTKKRAATSSSSTTPTPPRRPARPPSCSPWAPVTPARRSAR